MVKLGTYAAASAVGAAAVVFHAFQSRGQFYPAMLHLATSKISLVLLLNMALVLMCAVWQFLKVVFLGTLREAEVERLNEQSRRELMEILFAMTIFRDEFNIPFVAMVTVLLFIKAFHWLAQKRVEYVETTPTVSRLSHFRIISFMALLLLLDSLFLYDSVSFLLKTKRPSVSLFFAFEYVILVTSTIATFLKYTFYVCDMLLEGQWESKAVFTFYLELVRDLLHLSLYLFFFLVIFINYGLPLHLVRELYETFRNFKARVTDYIRYRKITSNMNDRFPDATPEELGRGDATCIICREEMVAAKKLPCGHLFHVQCLRSWLERQQTCPTCRSPVLTPDGGPAAAVGDGAAHPLQPQNQQQPTIQGHNSTPDSRQMNGQQLEQAPGESSSGSSYALHQARLQAVAAAASQYSNSYAYPAFYGREIGGYPTYMYLMPQAYLAPLPGLGLNAGAATPVMAGLRNPQAEPISETDGSFPFSTAQEGIRQPNQLDQLMMPSFFVPVLLHPDGAPGFLGLHNNSGSSISMRFENEVAPENSRASAQDNSATLTDNRATLNNEATMASLETQKRRLKESIRVLQDQLRRIVELQSQANVENRHSHPPNGDEPSPNTEIIESKGKAPACE